MNVWQLLGISAAYGATTDTQQQGGLLQILPLLILFFVIFYFLLIRPQNKRAREHRELLSKLSEDDEVVTSGGIIGRITQVEDDVVTLKIASGVEIKVQKQAITNQMPKGTLENF